MTVPPARQCTLPGCEREAVDPENPGALCRSHLADVEPPVVFHEPINPRGANFEMTVQAARDAGVDRLADALAGLRNRERWVEYALDQFRLVQELGEDLNLPVHLWPDDQLVDAVSGREHEWLEAWQEPASPEPFAGRDTADDPLPPSYHRHAQRLPHCQISEGGSLVRGGGTDD